MDAVTRLIDEFTARYGSAPTVLVRAPGRINLIGDHTDYSLLPVMPMAIDRAVYVALGDGPEGVEVDSVRFPNSIHLELRGSRVELEGWHRYAAAAMDTVGYVGGAKVLVDSDLPSTGGLASSTALTIGMLSALGISAGDPPLREELPELALAAERSVGVEGGAMDQTIVALAAEGAALRIDFVPPTTAEIPIPGDVAVVVGYSGTPTPKGDQATELHNSRIVAARAAALMLAHSSGSDAGFPPVLAAVRGAGDIDALPEEASAAEVAAAVGGDVDGLVVLTASTFDPTLPLPIRSVARHILTETERVDAAESALVAGDMSWLGRILDASHSSLREFGASSDRLDALTTAMRDAGAWGARLTGTGFGGFAVAICPLDRVGDVTDAAEASTGGPSFRVEASAGVSGM